MKKEVTTKRKGLKTKDLWWKKRQPQNAGAQNERRLMKKEATPKCKGLIRKTSNEKKATPKPKGLKTKDLWWKRGNPKMQGAHKKDLRWKKRCKVKNAKSHEGDSLNQKAKNR
jgi:hypothetical protein